MGCGENHQQTQLLFAEKVRLHKREGPWAFVEAIEQPQEQLLVGGKDISVGCLGMRFVPSYGMSKTRSLVTAQKATLHEDQQPSILLFQKRDYVALHN